MQTKCGHRIPGCAGSFRCLCKFSFMGGFLSQRVNSNRRSADGEPAALAGKQLLGRAGSQDFARRETRVDSNRRCGKSVDGGAVGGAVGPETGVAKGRILHRMGARGLPMGFRVWRGRSLGTLPVTRCPGRGIVARQRCSSTAAAGGLYCCVSEPKAALGLTPAGTLVALLTVIGRNPTARREA